MSETEDVQEESETTPETEAGDETQTDEAGEAGETSADETSVDETASVPEFRELDETAGGAGGNKMEMNRFGGVQVTLTAELGRTQLTIQEMMNLGQGSVVELDRAISAPVELVAQGVPLGNGEVVVIDNRFAVRIKNIYQN